MATKRSNQPKKDVTAEIFPPASNLNIGVFPWSPLQQEFINTCLKNQTKVVFLKASPGCGKTLMSLFVALTKLEKKEIDKIWYIRNPVESASAKIGYLPADKDSKMAPYLAPAEYVLSELVTKNVINQLKASGTLEALPIGFVKGLSFHGSLIFCDECQDLTQQEFELIMGRLGKKSLLILAGDERQNFTRSSGFSKVFNAFSDDEAKAHGIYTFDFPTSESKRSPISKFITDRMDNL